MWDLGWEAIDNFTTDLHRFTQMTFRHLDILTS